MAMATKKAFASGIAHYNSNDIEDLPGVENDLYLIHSLLKDQLGFQIDEPFMNESAKKDLLIHAL